MLDTTREPASAISTIESDIAAISVARTDLTNRLPTLRGDRIQAARAMLAGGGPRKIWQLALQAEQEAVALLADAETITAILEAELTQARWHANAMQIEARATGLGLRLLRVAAENDFAVSEGAEFLHDVVHAYEWLTKVGRTDQPDRKHAHTYWLDRAGHSVSLPAFKAAALCHGDIPIEQGDYFTAFGINEHAGNPARSLPLNGDPTPSTNRALITTVAPARPGYR